MIRDGERSIGRAVLGACAFMAVTCLAALPMWAQSPETDPPDALTDGTIITDVVPSVPDEAPAPDAQPEQVIVQEDAPEPSTSTQFETIAACEQSNESLIARLFVQNESIASCRVETDEVRGLLDACTAEYDLQRRTNIELNAELEACEQGGTDAPAPVHEATTGVSASQDNDELIARAVAAEELAADRLEALELAEAELEELRDLLERSGISSDPGFSYFGGTAAESYLTLALVQARGLLSLVPDQTRCGEMIAWLQERQAGTDFALSPTRLETWALTSAGPVVCSAAAGGEVAISEPVERGNEEAHLVLFR